MALVQAVVLPQCSPSDMLSEPMGFSFYRPAAILCGRRAATVLPMLGVNAALSEGGGRDGRVKAGTELVREFQGERHTVVITGEGFRWRDTDYPSLTAIARAITGTNWNGPRFFGLREGSDGKGVAVANPEAVAKPKASKGQASGRVVQ